MNSEEERVEDLVTFSHKTRLFSRADSPGSFTSTFGKISKDAAHWYHDVQCPGATDRSKNDIVAFVASYPGP